MTIQFDQISDDIILPLVYQEFTSRAPTPAGALVNPTCLLVQKTSAGTATAGARTKVASKDEAIALLGRGSMGARMCAGFFDNHPGGELYVIALADDSGGTAASVTITVTGPSTAAGTLFLRVGDVLVEVAVASGDSADTIAAAIEAKIDANLDLPVTSSTSTNVVTVTNRHKGTIGNQVPVTLNALGQAAGEVTPAGVGISISATFPSNGATDPASADWITGMADDGYDVVVPSLTTSGMMSALKTELETRWDPEGGAQVMGHAIAVVSDSSADLLTYAAARADKHLCVFGTNESGSFLTPACELAARIAGVAARYLATAPGRPIQRKKIVGAWGTVTNFSVAVRKSLAQGGVATLTAAAGELYIEAEVSTYIKNPSSGAPDLGWQYINTPFLMMRFKRRIGARFDLQFSDFSLVDDGDFTTGGQKVVSPRTLKGEAVAEYALMCEEGLMQGLQRFKETAVFERSTTNLNRVNALCRPQPVSQLRQIAFRNEFEG